MKNLITAILLLLFSFQCKIFKPSDLDPSQDLGSLQSLLRFLALADAFNTYSQTVAFMKFTDSNGNPYNAYKVEYSVFNEADENGVPVSDYGDTGNIRTYTLTLDPNGRGFLTFSERGIATLTVKTPGDVIVGSASFRIYNGITKQSFSFLSQTGATQFILEDLANYRNRMASNFTFTPLGSANGRQFIYFQVQVSSSPPNSTSVGYIASSADGENYDQVTKIDGVTIEYNSSASYQVLLKISKPTFNGTEYVFFLSEEKRDFAGPPPTFLGNRNLALRIPAFFTPSSSSVSLLPVASNVNLYRPDDFPWIYPAFHFGAGRYLLPSTYYTAAETRPNLLNADFSVNQEITTTFSCDLAYSSLSAIAYQIVNVGGTEYLQCPNSNALMGATTYQVRSLDSVNLSNRIATFDGSGLSFQSPPFFVREKFVALFGSGPSVGYVFNAENYTQPNPTLARNSTQISGFSTVGITGGSPFLRAVKSSGNSDFFILSSLPTFTPSPTINIFRSTDGLASASLLNPTLPAAYVNPTVSNAEQFQSANGKLNYSYAISAGTGIGTFPVYLTYFTNDDGTWEGLPRLIKIK